MSVIKINLMIEVINLINILIEHKDKKEIKKDIAEIKKVFDVVEMTDIETYRDRYNLEIEVRRKGCDGDA